MLLLCPCEGIAYSLLTNREERKAIEIIQATAGACWEDESGVNSGSKVGKQRGGCTLWRMFGGLDRGSLQKSRCAKHQHLP